MTSHTHSDRNDPEPSAVRPAWIDTESALPAAGQRVQFVLHRQQAPIAGVYAADGFRSRWTHYASELVCKWRGLIDGADADRVATSPTTDRPAARNIRNAGGTRG